MEKIVFRNISALSFDNIMHVFHELKSGKDKGSIDEEIIKKLIGNLYEDKFWHPTKEELDQHMKNWYATPVNKRPTDPKLKKPWDFSSWIYNIQNADITLIDIKPIDQNKFQIDLSQNSIPSGGIEAMELLIKIFDGEIIENSML